MFLLIIITSLSNLSFSQENTQPKTIQDIVTVLEKNDQPIKDASCSKAVAQLENLDYPWPLCAILKKYKDPNAISVYYKNLKTGETFSLNAEKKLHPASTLKLFVALAYRRLMQEKPGSFKGQDFSVKKPKFKIQKSIPSVISGSMYPSYSPIKEIMPSMLEEEIPTDKIVPLMLAYSDNLFCNNMIGFIGSAFATDPHERMKKGVQYVQETARILGAKDVNIQYGMDDMAAINAGLKNSATTADLGKLIETLHHANDEYSQNILFGFKDMPSGMVACQNKKRIREKIKDTIAKQNGFIASKTGTSSLVKHEVALIQPTQDPKDQYILSISGPGFDSGGQFGQLPDDNFADISSEIYTYFTTGKKACAK